MKKLNLLLITAALMTAIPMSAGDVNMKGVSRANLDETVSPGQDFYQYACGGWMKNNPLQPQYSRYGQFDALSENSKNQLRELIQNLGKQQNVKGSVAQKVNDLYEMGMDSVRLNKERNEPVKAGLDKIAKSSRSTFIDIIAWMHGSNISSPFFGLGIQADLMNSDANLIYLGQEGMGMGDRDYYLENDPNTVKIRNEYVKYIERLFTLSGYSASAAKKVAKNVMSIETELAKVAMTREEERDMKKQYNIRTIDQIKKDYPNINWNAYFVAIGLKNVDKVDVAQLKTMATVDKMLKTLPEAAIRDYLAYNYISSAASYLSDDYVQAEFDMFSKAMSGKKAMQPRWKRALSVPNGLLGEAVGELYVEKYFPSDSKAKMLKLVDNLKRALAEHIADLPWMSEKTKVNALVKLNSFTVKVGYPDKWKDYSKVNINPAESYWTNIEKALKNRAEYELAKYGKPVDKTEWGMTPQTVNAYYNPSTNEICFPAAILQAPYFDPNADDASNYGAIGVVIGHEMTHGFDDQGRQFDQEGNMMDWWTDQDAEKFKELTDKLADQYSAITVIDDLHANGRFTLGENIADHGGLRVAYSAFKKTEEGKSDKKIDGFTPDQRFYLSYANVWAGNITSEEIRHRTKIDPHSLGKWRVNAALRNIEPFFKAFDIKAGDPMFRPENERVTIW